MMMMATRNTAKRFFLSSKMASLHAHCPPPVRPYHQINKASFSSSSSEKLGFVGWYLRKLEAHPIVTKSITSSLIFTAADLTSQHMWFDFLSKVLPKRDVATTLKKIFLGQAVFGPIINTVFFSYNGVVQGENLPEIIDRLKRDLLPTLLGGALYWPVCDFVTFKFIPVHLQPLVNSSCAYLWTIYLTYMANRTETHA